MIISNTLVPLEVRLYDGKGRGICTREKITAGTTIEKFPVLVLSPVVYQKVKRLPFINHTFVWSESVIGQFGAIGFGYASLCNHSIQPNALIRKDLDEEFIDLVALTDIEQGEEVTIKYNNTPFTIC